MSTFFDEPDEPGALGTVVDGGRGSLPYSLVHGESLVAAAAWAMGEAGVTLVDLTVPWASIREAGEAFVLHDALCPLTPPAFIASCVATAVADDVVVVGVRPVTDTVKEVDPATGELGATLDRDRLVAVCSPVVLPPSVVAGLAELPGLPDLDFAAVAAALGADHAVVRLEAPSAGRRVHDAADVHLVEALGQE